MSLDLATDEPDPLDEPATRVELELHSIDGCLAALRAALEAEPWLAGAYRSDLAEIASAFTDLSQLH